MSYTAAFKARMVKRMTGRNAMSAAALANETGTPQTTLWRWKRDASSVLDVSQDRKSGEKSKAKRSQDWTPEEKLTAMLESSALRGEELGAYLRAKGLHEETLAMWRQDALDALGGDRKRRSKRSGEQKKIRGLEKDLRRKEKALAETTALLVLKKKFDALFEDEDDDTKMESDG